MRAFFRRVGQMSDGAFYILRLGVVLSCVCAVCAVVVLAAMGSFSARNYLLWQYAAALSDMPPALLLIAVLGSAIVEDISVQ